MFKAHKRTKSTSMQQKYRAARNRVTAMLRLSKTKYFRKLRSCNSKDFWKSIKLLNKKDCSMIPTLLSNGSEVSNSREKASLLNKFFYSCFNTKSPPLAVTPSNLPPSDCPPELLCNEAEVYDLIIGLDSNKSTGPDGICARMLKGTVNVIVPSLTTLFNLSLATGSFPDSWKLARIVLVPKSDALTAPSNYRPISILSVLSKLLERHVHQILLDFLCINHPLSMCQWGFLPGRCTASALLTVTHDWLQQLEVGNDVCSVFFDLKKAFDSVSHHLLLYRLEEISIDPYIVQWIRSYLTCRLQIVVVGGEESSPLPVVSGVPQGSVLGPLLFLIFINEIANQVSIGSQISLFADDIALYRPILNDADYCTLQSDVSAIVSWINNSLLSLQPAKCCCILFTRKRNSNFPPLCITVEGTPLTIVSSVKYLGLQINSDLSWSPHVAKLCIKARKLVGLLYRRFGKLADTATLLQLYKSFIRPNLEYCSVVWDPYRIGDIELLEKVQRFALRVCLKNWSCDREELYIQSKIPALAQRRSCARLHHMFKIANHLIDFPEPPLEYRAIH